ncbi:MAG: hypothetical protein EAZ64_00765 [Sphingobacteriales bacterium]|nr:MAG: hypothetical protein EAZ64_00765 [Sphingobacteriales bacterium]
MKKIFATLPPYVVLIIPVIIFIGLSFGIKKEISKSNAPVLTCKLNTHANKIISDYPNTFIQLLLKKHR